MLIQLHNYIWVKISVSFIISYLLFSGISTVIIRSFYCRRICKNRFRIDSVFLLTPLTDAHWFQIVLVSLDVYCWLMRMSHRKCSASGLRYPCLTQLNHCRRSSLQISGPVTLRTLSGADVPRSALETLKRRSAHNCKCRSQTSWEPNVCQSVFWKIILRCIIEFIFVLGLYICACIYVAYK